MKFLLSPRPLLAVAAAAVLSLTACAGGGSASQDESSSDLLPDSIRNSGVIKVGGPSSISPFMQVDESGKRSGIVFDLMTAVGKELGVGVTFDNIEYSALVPAILANRVDVGIGTFTDTVEREKQLDFVDFMKTQMVIMGKTGNPENIRSLNDLCGKPFSVPHGTTSEIVITAASKKCETDGKKPIELLVVASPAAAQLQVESGRAVAFIQAYGVGVQIQKKASLQIYGEPFRTEYHGAGIAKGDEQLAKALTEGFTRIIENGTYAQVLAKYEVSSLALEEPITNGQTVKPFTD